jgi:hypothetical protein
MEVVRNDWVRCGDMTQFERVGVEGGVILKPILKKALSVLSKFI